MEKNVVIVAGGENTRFKEMSIFPKVLLPTLNYPSILSYDCKLFNGWNVWLVMNKKYELMTIQYINHNKLNVNLIISDNHDGSANTLNSIKDQLPKNNVLFVWSDLILDKVGIEGIENAINDNWISNIIFTYPGKYRFQIDANNIISKNKIYNGNIPGIYWCHDINKIFNKSAYPHSYDYIEIFENSDNMDYLSNQYLGNITEFRDIDTYLDYYNGINAGGNKTRFFNNIIHDDAIAVKSCKNSDFTQLIDREIAWYKNCNDHNYHQIPKIYDYDNTKNHYIKMEWLVGYENIYKAIQLADDVEFKNIMDAWIGATKQLHNIERYDIDSETMNNDFNKEFYTKVVNRCDKISEILYKYNKSELISLLIQANSIIYKYIQDDICKYCFIHGDMNGSNVMWSKDEKSIKLIDPRGYFGNSMLMGPALYDYAKIMYCLSGYDNFNNQKYVFTADWFDHPEKLRDYNFGKYQNLFEVVVGIIWISLAEYISQDIFKANIAYSYGIEFLKNAINKINIKK